MHQFIVRHKFVTGFIGGALTALLLSGTGLALASSPAVKTYNACANKNTGAVRMLGVQTGRAGKKCAKTEKPIKWSAGAKGANVSTTVVTLTSADFGSGTFFYSPVAGNSNGVTTRSHDIRIPAITQAVLDSGSVQVAMTPVSGSANWTALPVALGDPSFEVNYVFDVGLGFVRVHFYTYPAGSLATWPIPTLKYKVTVIGG
jgi:hypothetical protein